MASFCRMKVENMPIKVDCYALKDEKTDIKTHIGYVLLPLRNIPLLPIGKALQAKSRWYKLLGLGKLKNNIITKIKNNNKNIFRKRMAFM